MAEYKDRIEQWRELARRKARELDEKYRIKERVEDGARAAQQAARRSAERLQAEAERLSDEYEVRERARRVAERAARTAREAGEQFKNVGQAASDRAEEVWTDARRYYERASRVVDASTRFARTTKATTSDLIRLRRWIREHPREAITVSLSLATGMRLGAAFPSLDGVLLGAHPHWLTHSALPVYALRKLGTKFDEYLRERERLIKAGELTEAERRRVEFERQMMRLVGAPLLGAFSCAAGVTMWAQIFQPGRITGAPISWLLGGNPVLDAIWLFGNGVVCIQQGIELFAIALPAQEMEKLVGVLTRRAATASDVQ
ncbi:MAG: hypothetical protein C4334_06430 [Pyrinomonas sp.]|uniref:hypothetical protein n=1 Tax=Pyrinomonas sp. TaxID=2080306 RepID=UPI00332517FD